MTEKILYFLIIEKSQKKIIYIAISIETLQIGALNEWPFSKPQDEMKNKCRMK